MADARVASASGELNVMLLIIGLPAASLATRKRLLRLVIRSAKTSGRPSGHLTSRYPVAVPPDNGPNFFVPKSHHRPSHSNGGRPKSSQEHPFEQVMILPLLSLFNLLR